MISIIIPVHNQEEMTRECIKSIQATTSHYEIIIVDNGSDRKVSEFYPFGEALLRYNIIHNEENLGFPKAVNQGIEVAQGDIIAILNNDLIVTPRWLEILQGYLSNGFDMIGPITNSISGPQQILIDRYDDQNELNEAAGKHHEANAGKHYPYHRLVFFCVAIKREVIDKIGFLDEIFSPGNFEDDDFCMRAIEAGFKLGIAQDCYVHHFGSVTHKALDIDYQELLRKNQKIFIDRWKHTFEDLVKKNSIQPGLEIQGEVPEGIIFTGERAIPLDDRTPPEVMAEHWARYQYALSFISGKTVLDIACGVGYGAHLMAEKASLVKGADISLETIEYCREHYPGPEFEVVNALKMPYLDGEFDAITSFETIEHLEDGAQFLAEVARVLKPDGTLLISCPFGGPCGNPYHKEYYQKGTFEPLLRVYFEDVNMLYQREDGFSKESISPDYCKTFTGEYAMAICTSPKKGNDEDK